MFSVDKDTERGHFQILLVPYKQMLFGQYESIGVSVHIL